MQHLIVGPYGLATLLLVIVGCLVLLVWGGRKLASRPPMRRERYFKLLFDVFTLVPVAVLLWNLMVYNFANTVLGGWTSRVVFGSSSGGIAFPDAIAGVGELPILIAVSVVVFRLIVDIWVDIIKR